MMSTKSMPFKGLRLLVVDDDPDTRKLLTFLFQLEGAEVVTAASAAEALERVSFFKPDLLICDICLPEEDGYSLLRKFRQLEAKRGRNIPAIALTASNREEDPMYAFLAGYHIHLCKPIDLDELTSAVASLVGI